MPENSENRNIGCTSPVNSCLHSRGKYLQIKKKYPFRWEDPTNERGQTGDHAHGNHTYTLYMNVPWNVSMATGGGDHTFTHAP